MRRHLSTLVLILLLAVVYYAAARLGLRLAFANPSATAVWPPTGIALVAVLLWGYRMCPGVFLGALLANLATKHPHFWPCVGIALGNTSEAAVGAWLVNRFAGGRQAFDRTKTIFRFLVLAAAFSTLLSATIGVTSLQLDGQIAPGTWSPVWLTWWIGDMVSNIIVAPLLLLWCANPLPRWPAPETLKFAALLAVVFLVGQTVFGGWILPTANYAIEYITIPPVLWAGWRFGLRGAATAAITLSTAAIAGTLNGSGPFAGKNPNEAFLLLQVFMATFTVTAIILASVSAERERAEKTALENQSRLAGLVDSAMDAIITVDSRQVIVLYNHAAEAMFGFPAAEMLGQPLSRLLPARFRAGHDAHIGGFGQTGVTNRRMGALGAISGLRASGQEFPIEASISQVEAGGGRFFTVILRDITEREQMEDALLAAQQQLQAHAEELEATVAERTAKLRDAISDLEAFSYSISHDLRAPLRVMRQYSEALLEDYGGKIEPVGRDFLRRIAMAAERLDTLICDVLAYNRVARADLQFRSVDLEKLVADVVENYPELQPHHARMQIDRPLFPVLGNEAFLIQCFSNLLGNAVKFVRPGELPKIRLWTEARGAKVKIWVEDNGIGIDPQHGVRIFGIFERLHHQKEYEGTGIGLAIVRKAVDRMGGTVGFESAPGSGARFWVELPAAG